MSDIKFKRNKETGDLEAYKGGRKVGEVKTMGDETNDETNKTGAKQNGKAK